MPFSKTNLWQGWEPKPNLQYKNNGPCGHGQWLLLKSQCQLISVLGKLHKGSMATYSLQGLPINNPNVQQYDCHPPKKGLQKATNKMKAIMTIKCIPQCCAHNNCSINAS